MRSLAVSSFVRSLVLVAIVTACGSSPPPASQASPSGEGRGCSSDADCGPGLACCYPCGVEGCENACLAVRPGEGCPAIP